MDAKTPHLMTRENPGDTRCSECGMTSGTKAHREGRAAQQASGQGAHEATAVRELAPSELTGLHPQAGTGFRAHSRRPDQCTLCTRPRDDHFTTEPSPVPGERASVETPDHADQVATVATPTEGTTMRATVKRADLVTALTYACKGIPARPATPALAGVVVTAAGDTLTAHTFDWETYRAGEAPAVDTVAGRIAAGGKTLLATVKAMKGKRVTLSATGADLTVSDGEASVTQLLMPVEDMPPVPGDVHVIGSMGVSELARHIGAVADAASTNANLPMMMCTRVRTDGAKIEFAATDRFRLHISVGTWSPATEDAAGEFLVAPSSEYLPPAKLMDEVTSLFVRRAGKRQATVTIMTGMQSGYPVYGMVCDGFRMITRSYDANPYPRGEKLFPAPPVGTIDVDTAALVGKITHVSGGLETPGNVIIVPDVPAETITLEFWPSADYGDTPAATATLVATFTGDVPAASAFTPRYLVDAVAPFTGTVRLEALSARKPFVITGDSMPGVRNLVMPVRIAGREDTPNVSATAPDAASAVEGVDQVPAVSDVVSDQATAPAPRYLVDGRSALGGALARPVPESSAVAILPAGALAAVTADPRPRDFEAYRDQIGMCACPLCTELAYHAHHWCDKRDQVHAARVLLAHLVAGTHVRMTLKERATEARAHRADLVRIAEEAGITGEELERVRDPHAFTMRDARAAKRAEFQNGLGLGIGNAPIRAEAEERRAAEAREATAAALTVETIDQGDTVPAGDQGDALTRMVREIIAGATWSFGSGTIGGGKRQRGTRFHGPIMHPALPDRRLTRDEWTALADQVRALGGGAWMRDVKGFACESGDAGNPWKAATKSTRERVAEWLASDQGDAPAAVPAVDAPAPAVEGGDQGDQGAAVSVDAGHPLAIDPSKPVTVTLVYSDRGDAAAVPAVETGDQGDAPAGDQVPALAEDTFVTSHGAHPQRVYVSGVGELNGYRFHLAAGVGCRQFGKPIRRAILAAFGRDSFHVTTPAGTGAVNVAATGDVADWSPVLALVAGIIGDKIATDSATCAECDRPRALAEN